MTDYRSEMIDWRLSLNVKAVNVSFVHHYRRRQVQTKTRYESI